MMTLKGETLLLENAGNNISKPLDFKTFLGGHAPRPPSGSRPTYFTLATALSFSLPHAARRPFPAIVSTDREPGTGYCVI